jgi:hypothetical protein
MSGKWNATDKALRCEIEAAEIAQTYQLQIDFPHFVVIEHELFTRGSWSAKCREAANFQCAEVNKNAHQLILVALLPVSTVSHAWLHVQLKMDTQDIRIPFAAPRQTARAAR